MTIFLIFLEKSSLKKQQVYVLTICTVPPYIMTCSTMLLLMLSLHSWHSIAVVILSRRTHMSLCKSTMTRSGLSHLAPLRLRIPMQSGRHTEPPMHVNLCAFQYISPSMSPAIVRRMRTTDIKRTDIHPQATFTVCMQLCVVR